MSVQLLTSFQSELTQLTDAVRFLSPRCVECEQKQRLINELFRTKDVVSQSESHKIMGKAQLEMFMTQMLTSSRRVEETLRSRIMGLETTTERLREHCEKMTASLQRRRDIDSSTNRQPRPEILNLNKKSYFNLSSSIIEYSADLRLLLHKTDYLCRIRQMGQSNQTAQTNLIESAAASLRRNVRALQSLILNETDERDVSSHSSAIMDEFE